MDRYAELHCHTNFSFLDGASHPEELVARASELGYTALGITDHDGFRGAVKVHQAAHEIGLPIVYGTEVGLPISSPLGEGAEHSEAEGVSRGEPESREARSGDSGLRAPDSGLRTEPVSRRGRIRRMHGQKPLNLLATDHLVLLAPSPEGYAAISRFVTDGQYRGEKDRPAYSYEDLDTASEPGISSH